MKTLTMVAMLCLGAFGWTTANATVIDTVYLNTPLYPGTTPSSPAAGANGAWLTASLAQSDTVANTYTLTLTSYLSGNDFLGGRTTYSVDWAFNLAGSTPHLTGCSGVCGFPDTFIYTGQNKLGNFNLALTWWGSNNRFDSNDSAVYTFTTAGPLSLANNSKGHASAALVRNISSGYPSENLFALNNCGGIQKNSSSWIVGDVSTPPPGHDVPEPSELPIMLLGITLLGGLYLRRRRAA